MTMRGTREAFIQGLLEAAQADPAIVLVCADSFKAARAAPFAQAFPDRVFDVGIAEQAAAAFAAGLASCGYKPYVNTYAGFIAMRALEQVRLYAGYTGLPVKFAGLNGGVYGGEREGVTHQFFEDLAALRAIPGMEIVVPADAGQVRQAVLALASRSGPGYIRLGSGREPDILGPDALFEFGKIKVLSDTGTDVALFTQGPVLARVLKAAELLKARGVGAVVVEAATLKPFDAEAAAAVAARCARVVTVEDHNILGGLGSAVAETLAERGLARPLVRVGIRDVFPQSGPAEALLDHYGMRPEDIAAVSI